MRLHFLLSFLAISFAPLAFDLSIGQTTVDQEKRKEFFVYFINRFAENVEPVSVELVADCISLYDGVLNKSGEGTLTSEQAFDVLGSLASWQLVASNKVKAGEKMPISKIRLIEESGAPSSELLGVVSKVRPRCLEAELRAHNEAIEKEKAAN